MTDFPQIGDPSRLIIHPHSIQALGVEYAALATAAPASVAWGTINLVRLYPFVLPEPMLVRKLWIYKGTVVTGSVDVGIYADEQGGSNVTRIVSSGLTAVAATASILQEFDITDIMIGRGRYYMAALMSLTTTTMFSNSIGLQTSKLLGWVEGGSGNSSLPATITLAAVTTAVQPVFGLSGRILVA